MPGTGDTWACNSIIDEEATPRLHRTQVSSYGNPTVHAHSPLGGAGMIPLDDVFETHSYANNSAFHLSKLPVQSDPPPWRIKSNVCSNHGPSVPCVCPVTNPPSISVVDPFLTLSPGASYTQEWAVYPLPSSCPDYYCFINTVRADVSTIADWPPVPSLVCVLHAFCLSSHCGHRLPVVVRSWGSTTSQCQALGICRCHELPMPKSI